MRKCSQLMAMKRMPNLTRAGLTAGIVLSGLTVAAQLSVAPQTNLQQLAEAISGPGVRISNPVVSCHGEGYGEFSYTGSLLGLESGVVLSSGRIAEALGPNNVENKTFQQGTSGSPLLNTVTGRTTYDACRFEFDVIPSGDSLSFQFVFGSEEYNEWVGSQYNDVFGFFISGPGIAGDPGIGSDHNIALVPNTSNAVAINNVNAGQNSAYYQYNAGGQQLQMDGYTRGLVARSVVQPCQTYHLKLMVADASDRKFDSWVFVERIQSPDLSLSTRTLNGTSSMVEGCNPGWIRFTRDPVRSTPLLLSYYLQGSATNGSDYTAIGNVNPAVVKTITIPGGAAFVEQPVNPAADALNEPTEYLRILLGNPSCPGFVIDSIDFAIEDTLIATLSPSGSQTICLGSSVQFQVTGGSSYAWSPAAGLSCTNCPNPIASPTTNTNYTVVITDGTCSRTASRLVRVSNPAVSSVVTQPLCNGQVNGAINITVNGGFAPFSYLWTGPNGFSASTEDLVGIAAGTYSVAITDNYGCSLVQSYNLGSPAPLSIALSPSILPFGQNIACNGASTGTLSLTITGGTGPHSIQWSGPNGFTSVQQNLTAIAAGTYDVLVTDANGCTAAGSYTMTQSTALSLALGSSQPTNCFGTADGQAAVIASGGMLPYSYSWNTSPAQTGTTASGLLSGTYIATVTDVYGCTAQVQAIIAQPAAVIVSLTGTSNIIHCQGQSQQHGTATAIATGGNGAFTYTWNTTPAQSTATATFSSGGDYTVTATDGNGCSGSIGFTVNQPGDISTSIVALDGVSCFAGSNGSATVSVTGGSNIQSAVWNTTPEQFGFTATNLPAGTWTLTAQHADGCTTQVPVTIAQPAAALGSSIASQSNVSCFGGSNGSASINVNGGTAPYTFNWNTTPAQSGSTAINLAAGSYACSITDANGCTATHNIMITQPANGLSSTISAQANVGCFGGNNGSATVGASGGTAPYTYDWNSMPAQATATATGLSASGYTCIITDANGCTTSQGVTIAQPAAALSSNISAQSNVSCFGGANGTVTVSANDGTAPYAFAWNTAPAQNGATAANLIAGTWTCTITDANGCSTAQAVTVTQPASALGSSITAQNNASCFAGANGSATAIATGGTGPYAYSWSTTPAQSGPTASNLLAGSYTCSVTDANGCVTNSTASIAQPAAPLGSNVADQNNVNCFGTSTGSATVSASGGTAPYGFSWNTVPPQTDATATNLPAGTWTCTITDANGCISTLDVTITQPAALLTSAISGQANVNCFGNSTGSATVLASGGTAPYGYSWNTLPPQNGTAASNLPAGTWTCSITDANGCISTRNVTITQPAAPLSSAIGGQMNVNCFGGSTGSSFVSVSGGTSPYSFNWDTSPVQAGTSASNLPAGAWTCTISDAMGCTTASAVTITQPSAPLSSSVTAQTNAGCFGNATGSATMNASGGTAPYVFLWNSTPATSGAMANNLPAGNWTCTITDANGCTTSGNASISQPAAALSLGANITSASCGGASNGAIDADITGGTSPYSITWSGPGGFASSNADISALAAGIYTLSVTDANGCSATQAYSVDQPGMFSISATLSDHNGSGVSCANGSDGSISITATGGTGPYAHAWSGPNGFSATTQSISAVAPGAYTYTITDSNGCSAAESFTLTAPPPMSLSTTAATANGGWNIACNGASTGSIDATIGGGLPPYDFSWNGPDSFTSSNEDIGALVAGDYALTVTDANGCFAVATVTLTQAPGLTGITSAISPVSCSGTNDASASASATGGTAPYAFAWNTSPVQIGPVASSLEAGTYQCTIIDANGCLAATDITIAEPAPLSVSITGSTDVLCHDGVQGTADALATGGTAPYAYTWSTAPAQNSMNATGLAQGNYTVTVTDAQGCTAQAVAVIAGPQAELWAAAESITHVSCFGLSDGSATLDITGGSGSYTITWNTTPPQSGPTATGLSAGNYLALVVDNNGCDHEKWVPVEIIGPAAPLQLALAITPITCSGASNGAVNLTMSGGLAPYTHVWSDDFGGSTGAEDLGGLDPDTYYLHAFDALGCVIDTSFVLTQPAVLSAAASITPATCLGAPTGAIDLTIAGGTAPYSAAWSGPAGFTATSEDINGLGAGNYTVIVMDANGCQYVNGYSVMQPGGLQASITTSSNSGFGTSCNGTSDGSIDLSVLGGNGSYTYAWSGPNGFASSSEDLIGLSVGTYAVQITDGNNCGLLAQAIITSPDPLNATALATSINGFGVSCNGASDGAISLLIDGGAAPYNAAWTGPNGFTSNAPDINGLAAGIYTASLTDANGCTTMATSIIAEPSAMIATAAATNWPDGTNISCASAADGAIDLSVSGGVLPYSIAWTDGMGFISSDEDVSGLSPGGYQATVTDANGCTASIFEVITEPVPLDLSAELSTINSSNVSCAGAMDGSIDLSITGGTAPYTIEWSNGSSSEDLVGIGAGTYIATVTDAHGCTAISSYNITEPLSIDIDLIGAVQPGGSNISCHGASDGSIETIINGGEAPFSYAWNGPGGFTSTDAAPGGLIAGTFTLALTDAFGCSAVAEVILTEPAPLIASINSTVYSGGYTIPCAGLSIGTAEASASGGTPGYSFAWSGPGGYASTDSSIISLSEGVYTVVATDINGCTGSASIALTAPAPLDAVIDIADLGGYPVTCAGNDGSASVSVLGGATPYFIGWTGPNGFASTQTSISGLGAGQYALTVIDANGCMLQDTLQLDAPEPISASFSFTANTCSDDSNGSIDLSLAGGAAPYAFAWTGPDGFSSADEDPSGLATGSYSVTITDDLGCAGSFAAELIGPAPINSGAYVSFFGLYNLQCQGDSSGVIELTPVGGTTPFSVAISGPGGYSSTDLINGELVAGDYLISIIDASGCALDTLVTLTEPQTSVNAALNVSVYPSGTNVSCFGASDGWIDASVIGGNGPYQFDWRGPDSLSFSSEDIFNLPAGSYAYELVVTDANQCTFSTTVTLTEPDTAIYASAMLSSQNGFGVSCEGAADGSIDLSYGGGNGGYAISWTGPNGFSSTNEDLNGLAAGTYTVTFTDMNGCSLTQDHVITAPLPVSAVLQPTDFNGYGVSCAGVSDGSISAIITGGAGGYELLWSGPNGFSSPDAVINALEAGTYCLSITDVNGCAAQQCVTLNAPDPLMADAAPTIASCGESNGAINLDVIGGTAPFYFEWSNGASSQNLSDLTAGVYTVNVTDANDCAVSTSVVIEATPAVSGSGIQTDVLCHGGGTGAVDVSVSTGTAPFSYAWSNGSDAQDLNSIGGGTYSLLVTDANGCTWSGQWTVQESQELEVSASTSSYSGGFEVSTFGGSDGSVSVSVSGGAAPYSYAWSNGSTASSLSGLTAGTYSVTITDANGCTITRSVTLEQPNDLVMPNGFTPNSDGHNDQFLIQGLDAYPGNLLTVINRWGNVVCERLNYKNDWAGENSTGEPLPNGTYFVILSIDNGQRTLQGYVDLRR